MTDPHNTLLNPQIIAQTALRILRDELLDKFIELVRKYPDAPWLHTAMEQAFREEARKTGPYLDEVIKRELAVMRRTLRPRLRGGK